MKKFILILCGVVFAGCAANVPDGSPLTSRPEIVPGGALFTTTQKIQVVSYASYDKIVYTMDGAAPHCESSAEYHGEITISQSMIIKARACKKDWQPSEIARAVFLKSD
jgi:hypothetical protein